MAERRLAHSRPSPDIASDYAHWTERAACIDVEPELFCIPGTGSSWGHDMHAEQRAEAEAVCAGCPVILECRRDALRNGDADTFRGGMTPLQRTRWDRQQTGAIHVCPTCDRAFTSTQSLGNHVANGHPTHCRHGHALTPSNVFMDRGGRRCRLCAVESSRNARARAKAAS